MDGDGIQDIVSGCYEGVPYWIPKGFKGDGKPQMIRDEDGGLMHTGEYYDMEAAAHTTGKKPASGPSGRAYSALPVDWDQDGDFDLIVGNDNGGIFIRENLGEPDKFAFSADAVALMVGEKPTVVPNGYAIPVAVDWDQDGLLDLVTGNSVGEVYWFRNTGKGAIPSLEAPKKLIGGFKAEGLGRGKSAQVEVYDIDADGDLDILAGDAHIQMKDDALDAHGYVWLYRNLTVDKGSE